VLTRPYDVARDPGDSPAVFDYVDTPFAEQLRVPVASLGRGRLQLGGFYGVVTTENLLWGPPASTRRNATRRSDTDESVSLAKMYR
jgi:hypothetical protein